MTAAEFARMLNARRIGKNKWQARCPVHGDKRPSLAIGQGKKGVLLCCMSHRCDTRDILKALGLTWGDLFDGKPTPEIRRLLGWEALRENLERQLGLVIWLGGVERGKAHYWAAAERRIRGELDVVRCRIEPERVYQELRGRKWQRMSEARKLRAMEDAWRIQTSKGLSIRSGLSGDEPHGPRTTSDIGV